MYGRKRIKKNGKMIICVAVQSVVFTPEDRKEIEESCLDKEFIKRQKPESFFQGFEEVD